MSDRIETTGLIGKWESLSPWEKAAEWQKAAPDLAEQVMKLAYAEAEHRRKVEQLEYRRRWWISLLTLILGVGSTVTSLLIAWRLVDRQYALQGAIVVVLGAVANASTLVLTKTRSRETPRSNRAASLRDRTKTGASSKKSEVVEWATHRPQLQARLLSIKNWLRSRKAEPTSGAVALHPDRVRTSPRTS